MSENIKTRKEKTDSRLLGLKRDFLRLRAQRSEAIDTLDKASKHDIERRLADVQAAFEREFPEEYQTLLHELVEKSRNPKRFDADTVEQCG